MVSPYRHREGMSARLGNGLTEQRERAGEAGRGVDRGFLRAKRRVGRGDVGEDGEGLADHASASSGAGSVARTAVRTRRAASTGSGIGVRS